VFSGIIEGLCEVREARRGREGMRVKIALGPLAEGVRVGDSIAVNGACLTVTELASGLAQFDVVSETLARTTLGHLQSGAKVNLERSLRIGDRLHGHFVQGHVDGVGKIAEIRRGPEGGEVTVRTEPALTEQMIPKGSVAVDGISLTIVNLARDTFSIAVIPHTMSVTTLGLKQPGDEVNLEADLLGKWVRRALGASEASEGAGSGLTIEKLRAAGLA